MTAKTTQHQQTSQRTRNELYCAAIATGPTATAASLLRLLLRWFCCFHSILFLLMAHREESYAHNDYVLLIFTIFYGKNNIAELPNTLRVT